MGQTSKCISRRQWCFISHYCFKHVLFACASQGSPEKHTNRICIQMKRKVYLMELVHMTMEACDSKPPVWTGSVETQGQVNIAVWVQRLFAAEFILSLGRSVLIFVVPFWPSTNLMKSTHITDQSLLYVKPTDLTVDLIQRISSQKCLEKCLTM